LANQFLDTVAKIWRRFPRCVINVCWIPGHEEVQGNEAADSAAKKASLEGSSHDAALPAWLHRKHTLPLSKSALKQKFYTELVMENSIRFAKSPRCNALRLIDESAPSKAYQDVRGTEPPSPAPRHGGTHRTPTTQNHQPFSFSFVLLLNTISKHVKLVYTAVSKAAKNKNEFCRE
jgi:hypothetical protein